MIGIASTFESRDKRSLQPCIIFGYWFPGEKKLGSYKRVERAFQTVAAKYRGALSLSFQPPLRDVVTRLFTSHREGKILESMIADTCAIDLRLQFLQGRHIQLVGLFQPRQPLLQGKSFRSLEAF